MQQDFSYHPVPPYQKTTEPLDHVKQSLLEDDKHPTIARASKRRLFIVAAVGVCSGLLVAALLTSYFLLARSDSKGSENLPRIFYEGKNSEGELFKESVEVDVSSHTMMHFANGHKSVTSLYLYEKKLMIVKDTQCYVKEYSETYEKDLRTLSTFQNTQGTPVQHRRVLYKLTKTMKREELIKLGGAAAGAFCPEKLVWKIETLNASVVDYQQKATTGNTNLPPTTQQPYHATTEDDGLLPSSTSFLRTDSYPRSTEEDKLSESSALGSDEDGSGEEDFWDFEYLDMIPYTIDDYEYRRKREGSHCEGLVTLKAELYPVECL